MIEPDQIRTQLESYLRQELDPTRMAEVKELIVTDPDYKSTFTALQSEIQGIRLNHLDQLKSKLQSLEANQKISENNPSLPGDLSQNPTSTSESNGTDELLTTTKRPESTIQDSPPDPLMVQGIRYTTLRDELKKLQGEERKLGGSGEIKKDSPRVVGLRRYWWAVAAGVAVMVIGTYYFKENNKPKYVNQYLLDHFDEYVLHDVERGSTDKQIDNELLQGYNLYYLKDFKNALPILKKNWIDKSDSLSLIYTSVIFKIQGNESEFKKTDSLLYSNSKYRSIKLKLKNLK